MVRKLTVGTLLLLTLGLAPQLTASPRVLVRARTGYSFHPGYRWYPDPWYPRTTVYFPARVTGELKIQTEDKDARVYVDGGYLGIARKVKKFDLRPGNHNIELRDVHGAVLFKERIAIVPGHTTVLQTPETQIN
jgi:hypothetical protein